MELGVIFARIMMRDLKAVMSDLEAYSSESDLWKVPEGISNSAGNLALHLAGNLRHFVGHVMGKTSYVRNRDAEFQRKNVSRAVILEELNLAMTDIQAVLPGLTESDMAAIFPVHQIIGEVPTAEFISHLLSHLNYHRGQINYHRRLIINY